MIDSIMGKIPLLSIQILLLYSMLNSQACARILDSRTKVVANSQNLHQQNSNKHDQDAIKSDSAKKITAKNHDQAFKILQESSKNWGNGKSTLIKSETKDSNTYKNIGALTLGVENSGLETSAQSGGSDWKSLAISVFCGTPGDRNTKSKSVLDALEASYPSYHWVVFVTEEENGWSYAYNGWECLEERSLCGPMDLLVWGRPAQGCSNNVESAASLLQRGAMMDATGLEEARDLMKSRESIYSLHYNLILTFYSGAWNDWLVQTCANDESNVNSMYSLWSGDLY